MFVYEYVLLGVENEDDYMSCAQRVSFVGVGPSWLGFFLGSAIPWCLTMFSML